MERPIPLPGRDLPMSRSKPRPSLQHNGAARIKASRAPAKPVAPPTEAAPQPIPILAPEKTVHVRPLIRGREQRGADSQPVTSPAGPRLNAPVLHDAAA